MACPRDAPRGRRGLITRNDPARSPPARVDRKAAERNSRLATGSTRVSSGDSKDHSLDNPLATKICLSEEIARYGWRVGDHSYGAPLVFDYEYGDMSIGRFCSIALGVSFILGNHRTDLVSTFPFKVLSDYWPGAADAPSDHEDRGGIHVGSDVWLGAHCTVLTGVSIGCGAIVAANAVVTRNVEPYAIVAGNPARVIRKRCSDEQIRELLAIAWWDWPDEKTQAEAAHLSSLSVDDFIRRYKAAS